MGFLKHGKILQNMELLKHGEFLWILGFLKHGEIGWIQGFQNLFLVGFFENMELFADVKVQLLENVEFQECFEYFECLGVALHSLSYHQLGQ